MYICIDFDGTIVDCGGRDAPVPGAVDWLRRLQDQGAKLILYTARSTARTEQAVLYLLGLGVVMFGVNENPEGGGWTDSPKPFAHLYVDDKSVGCPLIRPAGFKNPCVDWNIVGRILEEAIARHRQGHSENV